MPPYFVIYIVFIRANVRPASQTSFTPTLAQCIVSGTCRYTVWVVWCLEIRSWHHSFDRHRETTKTTKVKNLSLHCNIPKKIPHLWKKRLEIVALLIEKSIEAAPLLHFFSYSSPLLHSECLFVHPGWTGTNKPPCWKAKCFHSTHFWQAHVTGCTSFLRHVGYLITSEIYIILN